MKSTFLVELHNATKLWWCILSVWRSELVVLKVADTQEQPYYLLQRNAQLVLHTVRTTPPLFNSLPLLEELKACMTGFSALAQPHKPQHSFVLSQFSSPGPDSPVELFQFRKDYLFLSLSETAATYASAASATIFLFTFSTYGVLLLLLMCSF